MNTSEDPELRCPCGRLLARQTEGGIELKCTRCKRTVVLTWKELGKKRDLVVELHE